MHIKNDIVCHKGKGAHIMTKQLRKKGYCIKKLSFPYAPKDNLETTSSMSKLSNIPLL